MIEKEEVFLQTLQARVVGQEFTRHLGIGLERVTSGLT
jgi:hypothetical protein